MRSLGRVRTWHDADGWGVIDSDATPGGCWVHYSAVLAVRDPGGRPLRDLARLPNGVSLVEDTGRADWLVSRLNDAWSQQRSSGNDAPSLSTVVPTGYAAYVEVSLRNGREAQHRVQRVLADHTASPIAPRLT